MRHTFSFGLTLGLLSLGLTTVACGDAPSEGGTTGPTQQTPTPDPQDPNPDEDPDDSPDDNTNGGDTDNTPDPIPVEYTITTHVVPTQGGSIVLSPALPHYTEGSEVMVQAVPAAGYSFSSFSGLVGGISSSVSLTVSASGSITATFERITADVTLTAQPTNGGTLTITPAGEHFVGDVVTVTATPNTNYIFAGFVGVPAATNPWTMTLSGDTAITAKFVQVPTLDGVDIINGNTEFDLTATYTFGTMTPAGMAYGSNDHYEFEESVTSPTSGFTIIHIGAPGDRRSPYDVTLTRHPGTYYYRVRVVSSGGFSPYSAVHTLQRNPGAKKIRIINDLPSNASWAQWNTVVRLRMAYTDAAVLAGTGEQLASGDTQCGYNWMNWISPGDDDTFPVSLGPNYKIMVQTGWWEPSIYGGDCWSLHTTMVTKCNNTCCSPKAQIINVTNHTYDTLDVRLSDFLPKYTYSGSDFCD